MNATTITIIVIVIAVILIGGYFLFMNNQQPQTTNTQTNNEQTTTPTQQEQVQDQQTTQAPTEHEVIYTNAGFSPATLTIKAGDTVTFKNESSIGMWVGSGMHPTHTTYSGTTLAQHCPDPDNIAFDECKATQPGTSWSFTFTKVGEWPYHNHEKATAFGKIIVQ